MPKQPLAIRIHSDPAYAELVRIVGYQGTAYPIGREQTERLNAKYGKGKMAEAADELIDYDATAKFARLKPGIRRLCRGLLGPMPDEWDAFYAGVENPPPNPYKAPPDPATVASQSNELELLQVAHGRRLRELLLQEHKRCAAHPPGNPAHEEAVRRMDLIEPIMKGRGQKVPPRPAVSDARSPTGDERLRDLAGVDLMQRYFGVKRVLEEESEHSRAYRQAKAQYALLRAECERRNFHVPPTGFDDPAFQFGRATTHRLNELLDMNQYDLTKNEPDTVTFQEALRDIGFIETELRRRNREESARGTDSGSHGR
jgi:hypothetical protein